MHKIVRIRGPGLSELSIPIGIYPYNIGILKECIYHIFAIPFDKQILLVNGISTTNDTRIEDFVSEGKYWFDCEFELKINHDCESKSKSEIVKPYGREGHFQIFYRNFQGKTKTINVSKDDTVLDVKTQIQLLENLLPSSQRLIFGGKQLEDSRTLEDYNIQGDSMIYLLGRLI